MKLIRLGGFLVVLLMLFNIFNHEVLAASQIFCDSSKQASEEPADPNNPQVYTALGCIPVKIDKFVEWLLPTLFGIAGGISFLLMVYGFILVSTSAGDEKKVQGAKETITSAVTGLLVSIFALFILRLIAINILKIPGLN